MLWSDSKARGAPAAGALPIPMAHCYGVTVKQGVLQVLEHPLLYCHSIAILHTNVSG